MLPQGDHVKKVWAAPVHMHWGERSGTGATTTTTDAPAMPELCSDCALGGCRVAPSKRIKQFVDGPRLLRRVLHR